MSRADKAERDVRAWMADNCPRALARIEELKNIRAARLLMMGSGYPDGDIAAEENGLWLLVARIPGWETMVSVGEGKVDDG